MSPPDWFREWIGVTAPLLTTAAVVIPVIYRWLVKPILKRMDEHNLDHIMLRRELAINGDENLLPPGERGLPLRTLVIKGRLAVRDHVFESRPLMDQYRKDLIERRARRGD